MVTADIRHDRNLSNLSLFPMFFSQDRRSVLPRVICKYICVYDFKFLTWQLTGFVSGHSACWWNEESKYVYRQSQGWINSGSGVKWAASSSKALQWRHNGSDSVSNHQPHHCLLNRLFRRRSKKTLKLHVTGLCVGNSPGTGEFPAQMASYAENVSIWWRHHGMGYRAQVQEIRFPPKYMYHLLLACEAKHIL